MEDIKKLLKEARALGKLDERNAAAKWIGEQAEGRSDSEAVLISSLSISIFQGKHRKRRPRKPKNKAADVTVETDGRSGAFDDGPLNEGGS